MSTSVDKIVRVGSPGVEFAHAVAAKDRTRLTEILADDIDFRGLTTNQAWQASSSDGVIEVLSQWFEEQDEIKEVLFAHDMDDVVDRHHVSYRFRIDTPDGPRECQQQMYYEDDGSRITLARILCSGFRPLPEE